MAFGLLKRNASTADAGKLAGNSKTAPPKPRTELTIEPQLDATECTTDREDDDGSNGSGIVEEVTSDPRLVELHHDLRAKTAQVSVLRDTLTNLSNQFREQSALLDQSQITIAEKDAEISRLSSSLEQLKLQYQQSKLVNVTLEEEWKEKYDELDRILERAIDEKDQWKIKFEELQFDQEDALLGQKQIAQPQSHCLWSDDDEAGLVPQRGYNDKNGDNDDDSMWDGTHGAEGAVTLDVATRPPAFTNRPGPFRRKKQRPVVKPFQTKPMEWVMANSSSSSSSCSLLYDNITNIEPANTDSFLIAQSAIHNFEQQAANDMDMSKERTVDDVVSKAQSERSDAKARARRVRKTAKKMSAQAGFDCQKLEC